MQLSLNCQQIRINYSCKKYVYVLFDVNKEKAEKCVDSYHFSVLAVQYPFPKYLHCWSWEIKLLF